MHSQTRWAADVALDFAKRFPGVRTYKDLRSELRKRDSGKLEKRDRSRVSVAADPAKLRAAADAIAVVTKRHANGVPTSSLAAIKKAQTLRKTMTAATMAPHSSNATSGGPIAATGATNIWRDITVSAKPPALFGTSPHSASIGLPSRAALAAPNAADSSGKTVDAIKQDLWPAKKKTLSAAYAARPAVADVDNGTRG